ncbi:MAG: hypothetical protein SFV51_12635 [Bryobacteraceae bacterium]|nr:hypothetical protein [Bryobacteraceae bacterium]
MLPIWPAILTLPAASLAGCQVDLPPVKYPPLAIQARIQGTVIAAFVDGEIVAEGHALLKPVVAAAIRQASGLASCPAAVSRVTVHFAIAKGNCPVIPMERLGPAEFRVVVAEPCLHACGERIVRRFWFFKRRISVCETICPPCIH